MKKNCSLKYNEALYVGKSRRSVKKLIFGALLFALGASTIVYSFTSQPPMRVYLLLAGIPFMLIGGLLFRFGLSRKVGIGDVTKAINYIDTLSGEEFEVFCARMLDVVGYEEIELNGASGDQGADILAKKDGIRFAVQCKHRRDPYKTKYGNKPVQEVHASLRIYNCDAGFVITNGYFTKGAVDAAEATGVLLWDRDKIISVLRKL